MDLCREQEIYLQPEALGNTNEPSIKKISQVVVGLLYSLLPQIHQSLGHSLTTLEYMPPCK